MRAACCSAAGVEPPKNENDERRCVRLVDPFVFVALGEVSRDRVFIYDTTNDAWLQAEVAADTPAPPISRGVSALVG